MFSIPVVFALVILFFVVATGARIVNEYERGVIFRFGKYASIRNPGLNIIIPFIDQMVKIDLRTIAKDIPPQDVITKDNVSVNVNAVLYFKVIHPDKAILEVDNYMYATSQLAQTTLRSILGQVELDELLAEREQINERLQAVLDENTDKWGIKVTHVELKHVDLPQEMQRAMAKQAEAERERRAKVIAAEGEFQASAKLAEAANIMATNPITLQLRYLQSMTEISSEKNSKVVLPIPLNLGTLINDFQNGFKENKND